MQRLTSLCYSLVCAPSLCFRVRCGSGTAPVDCVRGAFSCKRSSRWDHQAPVNWTFTYLCRGSGWTYCFNEEFISRRWGARFNEPLPGFERWETWNKQSALSSNVCCPLLPAAVKAHTHTHTHSDAFWSKCRASVPFLMLLICIYAFDLANCKRSHSCLTSMGGVIVSRFGWCYHRMNTQ